MYGFYSAQAVKFGSIFYFTPDGREVEVTAVYDDKTGEDYKWPDKVCVGEVGKFSRNGLPRTTKNYE